MIRERAMIGRLSRLPVLAAVSIAMILSFALGCDRGPTLIPVSGVVVFKQNDTPAQFGTVEFRSESDPPLIARSTIGKDGSFELRSAGKLGIVPGWHTVVVVQVVSNPRTGKVDHHHGLDVSKKHLDHRTTDLRVEINPDFLAPLVLRVEGN